MGVDRQVIELRICRTCCVSKPLEDFHKNPLGRCGRHTVCKKCRNAERRALSLGLPVLRLRTPNGEKPPLIDVSAPPDGPSKVHGCGNALAFITDTNGHCLEVCDRCHVTVAFGR